MADSVFWFFFLLYTILPFRVYCIVKKWNIYIDNTASQALQTVNLLKYFNHSLPSFVMPMQNIYIRVAVYNQREKLRILIAHVTNYLNKLHYQTPQ